MIEVVRYRPSMADQWNAHLASARNGHFFFNRGYLDYHAGRFLDHSVMVLQGKRVLAAFPANRVDDVIYSHQGLTFGGLIVGDLGGERVLQALDAVCGALRADGVRHLVYKAIPGIFHRQPAQEDLYALHRAGARLLRRELSSALATKFPHKYTKGKLENLRRAASAGLAHGRESEVGPFMALLERTLDARHELRPVHSELEMRLLFERFPENIRVYGARREGRLCAGALVFLNPMAAHTQYLANSEEGREIGALDFLIDRLLRDELAPWPWLSFGISSTDQGQALNPGLLHHKEAFGARGIVHDTYALDL